MAKRNKQEPRECDQCGKVAEWWTIAKGFDLLCDDCLIGRLATDPKGMDNG